MCCIIIHACTWTRVPSHKRAAPRVELQGFTGAVTMGREVLADLGKRLLSVTSGAQSQLLMPGGRSDHRRHAPQIGSYSTCV